MMRVQRTAVAVCRVCGCVVRWCGAYYSSPSSFHPSVHCCSDASRRAIPASALPLDRLLMLLHAGPSPTEYMNVGGRWTTQLARPSCEQHMQAGQHFR